MSEELTPNPLPVPPKKKLPEGIYLSDTVGKVFGALCKAQGKFGIAAFDSKNPFFNDAEFASLVSVMRATKEQLAENGLAVIQQPHTNEKGNPCLFTIIGHESGEYVAGDLELLLSKRDMQGLGSAITYGRRYSKSASVGVVSDKDDDGNEASGNNNGHADDDHTKGENTETRPPAKTSAEFRGGRKYATEKQVELLKFKASQRGIEGDDLVAIVRDQVKVTDLNLIPFDKFQDVLGFVQRIKMRVPGEK